MQVCVLAAGGLPRALSFAAFLALCLPQAHGIGHLKDSGVVLTGVQY
jgi:hypothetical protein